MTALIDADSIIYIIAWNYREMGLDEEVQQSCDNYLKELMALTGATNYIGVFSAPSDKTFRFDQYRYARYKGNRPEKPDFMRRWEKVIKERFMQVHKFVCLDQLEADDVVAAISEIYRGNNMAHFIASPDKDLKQVPGLLWDYKQAEPKMVAITKDEAFWHFWTQMLTGDPGDNIAGVPGLGEVKAGKIITDLKVNGDKLSTRFRVLESYTKYFGDFYGPLIFNETEQALRLITMDHPMWMDFAVDILAVSAKPQVPVLATGFFDIPS